MTGTHRVYWSVGLVVVLADEDDEDDDHGDSEDTHNDSDHD